MPSRKNRLGVVAGKGEALTLDDYAAFVEDAKRAGVSGDAVPVAKVRFSGKVHTLTVETKGAQDGDLR